MMRKCKYKYYANIPNTTKNDWKEEIGLFHQWGYQVLEEHAGNTMFSVALVETSDGEIKMVHPEFIKFINY